ncbi:MAG: helix-turn-helix domain-containing protein [Pseudomonadota bacterium]|nr:helix-turn-helix domain-containing protein [Pseudomonadota bacterium]
MDQSSKLWYYSNMSSEKHIPSFTLFGETSDFPDVIHVERIWDRARLHDWKITPHRHEQMYQVFHLARGHAEVELDGRRERLSQGTLLFVPPRTVHGFAFAQGTEGDVLSFPSPVIKAMQPRTSALDGALQHPFMVPATDVMRTTIAQLMITFQSGESFRTHLLVAFSHALIAAIAAARHDTDPARAEGGTLMDRLNRLIADHHESNWRTADYADALSVSAGHLSRTCRKIAGLSANAYIEHSLMTEACRLLAFTQLPVAEIGYRLGFADPAYFSRRFRAARGEAPSDYRARFVAN